MRTPFVETKAKSAPEGKAFSHHEKPFSQAAVKVVFRFLVGQVAGARSVSRQPSSSRPSATREAMWVRSQPWELSREKQTRPTRMSQPASTAAALSER